MNIAGKRKERKTGKVIAAAITTAIIILLVLSGPANAFSVKLNSFAIRTHEKGQVISTTATITIDSNERINLDNVVLYLDKAPYCAFAVNAPETNCAGINIKLIGTALSSEYGYGYGYGYSYGYRNGYSPGTFTYKITLDTDNFSIGDHDLQLKLNADNNPAQSGVVSITINPQGASETETNINVQPGVNTPFLGGDISISLNGTGRVVVSSFPSQPNGTNTSGIPALGKWFEIDSSLSDVTGTEIRVYYTPSELSAAGLDKSNLKLYFYNGTNWILPLETGVNAAENYVYAITDHFSIWGVFGSKTQTNSGNGNGGYYPGTVRSSSSNSAKFPADVPDATAPDKNKNIPEVINLEENLTNTNRRAGITGAVIGLGEALGSAGNLVVLFFILGIVAMAITVNVVRNRKKRRDSYNQFYAGNNVEVLR